MFTAPAASKDPQTVPPPHREGPDFYDAQHWENAYRHFDDSAVPQILLFLQDDLARSRRREAAWLSVIVHLFVVILLVNQPYLMKFFPSRQLTFVPMKEQTQETPLFLDMPPSPKPAKPPNTNIISDQDRIATSKTPRLDPKELRKILDSNRPGRPGAQAAPSQQQAPTPAQQAGQAIPAQGQPQPQQGQPEPAQQNTNQTAQLQTPAMPPARRASPSVNFKTGGYVGSQINQAANAAAQNRNVQGGDGGDFGRNLGNGASAQGQMEILSDTMGVDFGPYLARVVHDVRENWINAIPESAKWKKGKVSIEFAILKDGSVAGMRVAAPSGDIPLDRAAWAGITGSNPFQPLPAEFKGQYLLLRFSFYYNLAIDGLH